MKTNDFDTRLLSRTVVDITDPQEIEICVKKYINGMAHLEHSELSTGLLEPHFTSEMLSLECSLDKFSSILQRLPQKYPISLISKVDEIDPLLPLVKLTINNRFSNDPKIGPKFAVPHKKKLMETHFNNGYSVICKSQHLEEVIGFHQMMIKNNELVLYEIATSEDHRNGLLAISLLKEALKEISNNPNFTNIKVVVTKIYSDNTQSLNFFKKLGFEIKESKYHSHFHF
jgi:ribosomal protein S18 acetylase RimI-like enzyme